MLIWPPPILCENFRASSCQILLTTQFLLEHLVSFYQTTLVSFSQFYPVLVNVSQFESVQSGHAGQKMRELLDQKKVDKTIARSWLFLRFFSRKKRPHCGLAGDGNVRNRKSRRIRAGVNREKLTVKKIINNEMFFFSPFMSLINREKSA